MVFEHGVGKIHCYLVYIGPAKLHANAMLHIGAAYIPYVPLSCAQHLTLISNSYIRPYIDPYYFSETPNIGVIKVEIWVQLSGTYCIYEENRCPIVSNYNAALRATRLRHRTTRYLVIVARYSDAVFCFKSFLTGI